MNYIGEISALLGSLFWAGSNFALQSYMSMFTPTMLNFAKCSISTIFLVIILNLLRIEIFPISDIWVYIKLMLSGICGIAVGDTFYFIALNELGARKALLIETLAPPMTGIIAYMYYGTTIPLLGWLGVVLTLYGLYVVVGDKHNQKEQQHDSMSENLIVLTTASDMSPLPVFTKPAEPDTLSHKIKAFFTKGVLCGVASMFFASLGIVMSSSVLTGHNFNPLSTTFLRIAPANLALFPVLKYIKKEAIEWPRLSALNNLYLILTIIISTVGCVWMSQISLAYTRPEISQTLIATSPIFGLTIGMFKGEHITAKQTMGSFVSVFGVLLIVQS